MRWHHARCMKRFVGSEPRGIRHDYDEEEYDDGDDGGSYGGGNMDEMEM